MKKSILLLLLMPALQLVRAQDSLPAKHKKTRNIIWFTPSGTHNINGLAIGLVAYPFRRGDCQKINGANVEAGLAGVLTFMYALPLSFRAPFSTDTSLAGGNLLASKNAYKEPDPMDMFINGISISPGGLSGNTKMSGISINGLASITNIINGVSAAGFMNITYAFYGVQIGGIRNKATTGKGLMIGLFNNCRECKGVQLGLINMMGKRTLPIINMRLR